ncbi:hypothetical protein TRAPUB_12742 [Trametes pubescens]|uniref:Uncharacterized protein n=1 Tax=Trametes pubescens TaxID=154538 RepID=A0A1M2VT00_TRAPU|nr:hypothetical protein TRAPUB_12742 [Trametes pubescens]
MSDKVKVHVISDVKHARVAAVNKASRLVASDQNSTLGGLLQIKEETDQDELLAQAGDQNELSALDPGTGAISHLDYDPAPLTLPLAVPTEPSPSNCESSAISQPVQEPKASTSSLGFFFARQKNTTAAADHSSTNSTSSCIATLVAPLLLPKTATSDAKTPSCDLYQSPRPKVPEDIEFFVFMDLRAEQKRTSFSISSRMSVGATEEFNSRLAIRYTEKGLPPPFPKHPRALADKLADIETTIIKKISANDYTWNLRSLSSSHHRRRLWTIAAWKRGVLEETL